MPIAKIEGNRPYRILNLKHYPKGGFIEVEGFSPQVVKPGQRITFTNGKGPMTVEGFQIPTIDFIRKFQPSDQTTLPSRPQPEEKS